MEQDITKTEARIWVRRQVEQGKIVKPRFCGDCEGVFIPQQLEAWFDDEEHERSGDWRFMWVCRGCHTKRKLGPKGERVKKQVKAEDMFTKEQIEKMEEDYRRKETEKNSDPQKMFREFGMSVKIKQEKEEKEIVSVYDPESDPYNIGEKKETGKKAENETENEA